MFKLFKKLTMHTDNTQTEQTTETTLVDSTLPMTTGEAPAYYMGALDPASTPPSTDGTSGPENLPDETQEELGTQQNVQATLKLLAVKFACVEVKKTEQGTELYLFTQTKVAHPTFVETIRKKLAVKEDVGNNHILTGTSIEDILLNLKVNEL